MKRERFRKESIRECSTGARICATEFIVTIDPDDARDFDDAINVEKIARRQLAARRAHRGCFRLRDSRAARSIAKRSSAATAFICRIA